MGSVWLSGCIAYMLILITFFSGGAYGVYNGTMCCVNAKQQSQFLSPVPENVSCGQTYDTSHPPAPDLYVTYSFCASNCGGIGLSQPKQPGEWAAPLVQFILPSVIFAMSIPRRKHVDFDFVTEAGALLGSHVSLPYHCLTLALTYSWATILLLLDTAIWMAIIIIGAGCLMVAGLYEALLDHRVLDWIKGMDPSLTNGDDSTQLLVAVVSGNLRLQSGSPDTEILEELIENKRGLRQERLLSMMSAQSSFGAIVGAPVVFYLGAFIYTILDLMNDPSDQDAAISLAFGVEWMIIPHVAIVSGVLLASNNPSTASVLTGTSPRPPTRPISRLSRLIGWKSAYDSNYQPVSMWSRGDNKMAWLKESREYGETRRHINLQQHIHIQWWEWLALIFVPALVLISLPATAGALVAYDTPPIGWGCRSLSFIVYAGAQVVLIVLAVVRSAFRQTDTTIRFHNVLEGIAKYAVLPLMLFVSLVAAVGGTLMQIIGVFRNCICYVNAQHWTDIYNGRVNVASDTFDQRNASRNWLVMGSVATGFMGFCCCVGWLYTRSIRQRFREQVMRL